MPEMHPFLHPAFKSLRYLESILPFHKATTARAEVFENIVARTCEIVAARNEEKESSVAEQETAKKKQKFYKHAISVQKEQLEQLETSDIMTFGDFEDEVIKQDEKKDSSDKGTKLQRRRLETI